jgi:hypothetical protein
MIEFLLKFAIGVCQIAAGIALYVCLKEVWDTSRIKFKKFYKRQKRKFKNWLAERKKSA